MANKTFIPNLAFTNIAVPGAPIVKAATNSLKGSGAVTLDNPILMTEGGTKPTLEMMITWKNTEGKYMQAVVPAGGFTSSTVIAGMKRGIELGGIDLETENSDLDIDLLEGSQVVGAVPAQLFQLVFDFLRGQIASGGQFLYLGNGTNQDYAFGYRNAAGLKYLFRINTATSKAQYSNDGSTWVNMDTPAPANVTTRTTTAALANNGELYQDTGDSNSLHLKDNGGADVKLVDDATQKIPLASVQNYYAADAGATDAYAITLTPAPTAYVVGQEFDFKANTANTGACTLNVNALGALTIQDINGNDLITGAIPAGKMVKVKVTSGTTCQMMNQPGLLSAVLGGTGADTSAFTKFIKIVLGVATDANAFETGVVLTTSRAAAAATPETENIAHGLGKTPKLVLALTTITATLNGAGANVYQWSLGGYDGTNCKSVAQSVGFTAAGAFSSTSAVTSATNAINAIKVEGGGANAGWTATITYGATNVSINWTKTGAGAAVEVILLVIG